MSKLQKLIQSIPNDKKDHIIMGEIIGLSAIISASVFCYFIGSFFNIGGLLALIGANFGGAVAIGFFTYKEIYIDKIQGKGTPELWDFIASSLPVIGYLLFINLFYFI